MPQPTPALMIGPNQVMAQNTIYAMPARAVKGYTNAANLMGNYTLSTTGATTIAVTNGEFETSAPFIYCTTSAPNVRLVALD